MPQSSLGPGAHGGAGISEPRLKSKPERNRDSLAFRLASARPIVTGTTSLLQIVIASPMGMVSCLPTNAALGRHRLTRGHARRSLTALQQTCALFSNDSLKEPPSVTSRRSSESVGLRCVSGSRGIGEIF